MDVTIRLALLPDLPAVLELMRALDVGTEPALAPATAQVRFLALTATPAHRIYVAEQGTRTVGTFALTFVGGLAHGARPSCVVEDVVVAADCRGQGIGRSMMRFAMRVCAAEDCYKLVLSSHVQREAAHRFYEGLGFRRHGYSFLIQGDTA